MNDILEADAEGAPQAQSTAAAIIDADGIVRGWTDSAQQLLGYTSEEVLGRPAADLLMSRHVDSAERGATQPCRVRGDEREAMSVRHRDGHPLHVNVQFLRLSGQRNAARWLAVATFPLADDSRRAMLSGASTRIGTTLDVMVTAQELADYAVPRLADYVTVDLAESVPLGSEPLTRVGTDAGRVAVFRRAGLASIHQHLPESLWTRGAPVFVPPQSPFTAVLDSGVSHLEPVLDTATWRLLDPERGRVIERTHMHTVMMVPITARGTTLGIAVFVRTENPAAFDEGDLCVAEDLVGLAALSLDSANRYSREHAAALALQRHLLPDSLHGGSAVEVSYSYRPADMEHGVGGDWYDAIPLSHGRVALVVGDVVGHGIGAAATMGRLRTAIETLADLDLPPDELLTRLDRTVTRLRRGDRDDAVPEADEQGALMSGTCLYAVFSPAENSLQIARAGHLPPLLVSREGEVSFPDTPPGVPIGVGLPPFESTELSVEDGTLIALYTDGMVETPGEDIDAGMERLAAALAHRSGLPLEALCTEALDALRPLNSTDDATLLLARHRPSREVDVDHG
ncbi:SpoIIE family protein phosphatase [Streptomyces winkii]|uniref:SpoIIE family protein phosphatase n=1 Tax=Streptomyces winkii TaxID=3051178 RepID=UPI0028D05B48|nr:SpoIIE family protein phosphatase [Streptomyces sp. DSM 40971]